MKPKKIIALLYLSLALTNFAACTPKNEDFQLTANTATETDNLQFIANSEHNIKGMFSARDTEITYNENSAVLITLSDSGITSSSKAIDIRSNTITISNSGIYLVRGSLSNGQIIVKTKKTDTVQLVLDNITLNSNTSAPIYIQQADKVFITLANSSKNSLSTQNAFIAIDNNNIDAVIYSQDDLTFNGKGSLILTTKNGNGIVSKDDLVFTGGNYEITSTGHGLEANDSVRIADSTFIITSDKDGIHSENKENTSLGFIYIENGSFDITAEGDGFDARGTLQIINGNFTITTSGGSKNPPPKTHDSPSTKALKSDSNVIIYGGTFNIDSFDDSIHSNKNITITGGNFTLSSGDDAIHADTHINITDGNITILNSYEGIEGMTVDIAGGNINITARDDGINAISRTSDEHYVLHISGGLITIHSTDVWGEWNIQGGDAIDANGDLLITGGEIYISGTTSHRETALDFDYNTATITGGIIVATGDYTMAQNFDNTSTQGSILVPSQNKQTGNVKLQDNNSNELLSFTPKNEYNSALISTPDIKQGETYTVIMGTESQTVKMTNIIFGESQIRGPRRH